MYLKYAVLLLILWQYNCSFVIPPITLTGTKTAAEKQIIGDQNEIEEDVWMISSAKSSSESGVKTEKNDDVKTLEEENAYTNRALSLLNLYAENIAALKKDKVVGEGNKGLLINLLTIETITFDEEILSKYDKENIKDKEKGKEYRKLLETVKQVNLARDYLAQGYILHQTRLEPEFKASKEELLIELGQQYRNSALKGEYIQNESGVWLTK